jgi:ketosteroid isomerase-like protein
MSAAAPALDRERAQDALLDRLFAAISARDLDGAAQLYADDIEVHHNTSDHTRDRDGGLAVLGAFLSRTESVRYDVLERRHWDGGAVQRHVLRMRVGGADYAVEACIVFGFAGGRISRIHEYLDGRALAPLGW